MAGTGKSTIARTVARSFAKRRWLGGSFFKQGQTDQTNLSKFVTTIAAQLVNGEPSIAPHIKQVIDVNRHLRRDVCKLQAPRTLISSTKSDSATVPNTALKVAVKYACRFWVHHLQKASMSTSDDDEVYNFLREHFLHWIESFPSFSSRSASSDSRSMMGLLINHMGPDSTEVLPFLVHAARFISTMRSRSIPVDTSALYTSALAFAPKCDNMRNTFNREMPSWISLIPEVNISSTFGRARSEGVNSVFISKNEKLAASASDDGTVRIWSTESGHTQKIFKGNGDLVSSVAFSYDSKLVLSVAGVKTVRIWSSETGHCLRTLKAHSDRILSADFSHDSRLVASASVDGTVQIWSTETGDWQRTLEGHSDKVNSVTFSHDSKLIASASNDRTVRIWSTETGEWQRTLEGHGDGVNSVTFSHDSKLVASTSDGAIRIWSTNTGYCQQIIHVGNSSGLILGYDTTYLQDDAGAVYLVAAVVAC